jgi:RNA polymerase sigma factor for flagellar operon FliA
MTHIEDSAEAAKQAAARQAERDALWKRFKATGDAAAKDALLTAYIPLVRQVARRMMPKYNAHTEYDELVSSGVIGLIDAVDKYDPAVGVKFETYAVTRIRGEILDQMRAQDWAPASLRKRINAISKTFEDMETAGENPTQQRVAEKLGLPVAQVQKAMAKTHTFAVISFEDTLGASLAGRDVAAPSSEIPENQVVDADMRRLIAQMITDLPEKERLVVTLYYYEDLRLKEIAEVLGVTESRVSQIHSRVLTRMRQKLQKML